MVFLKLYLTLAGILAVSVQCQTAGTEGKSLIQYKYEGCYDDIMAIFELQDMIDDKGNQDMLESENPTVNRTFVNVADIRDITDQWRAPLIGMEIIASQICPRVISDQRNKMTPTICSTSGISLYMHYKQQENAFGDDTLSLKTERSYMVSEFCTDLSEVNNLRITTLSNILGLARKNYTLEDYQIHCQGYLDGNEKAHSWVNPIYPGANETLYSSELLCENFYSLIQELGQIYTQGYNPSLEWQIQKADQLILSLFITSKQLPGYYQCVDEPTDPSQSTNFKDRCVDEYFKDVDFWIYNDELKQQRCNDLSPSGKVITGCTDGFGTVYNSIIDDVISEHLNVYQMTADANARSLFSIDI